MKTKDPDKNKTNKINRKTNRIPKDASSTSVVQILATDSASF